MFSQNVPLFRPRRLPTISTSFTPAVTVVWNTPTSSFTSDPVSTSCTATDKVAVEGTVFTIQLSSQTGETVLDLTDDVYETLSSSEARKHGFIVPMTCTFARSDAPINLITRSTYFVSTLNSFAASLTASRWSWNLTLARCKVW